MSHDPHEVSPFAGLDVPAPAEADSGGGDAAFADLGAPAAPGGKPTGPLRTARRGLPWTVKLLVVLVPYAALLTAFAVYLLQNRTPHPLEQMADQGLYEDYLAGKRRLDAQALEDAGKARPAQEIVDPAIELSPSAPLRLGETRRIGSLELTPLKIWRGRWTYAYKNGTADFDSLQQGLLLQLRCKNLSETIFAPDDPTFNRASGKHAVYTYLTLETEKYYGPVANPSRERIKGQNFVELLPDDEMDTLILAAPHAGAKGELLAALDKLPPDTILTWRVHLRRGQEEIKAGGTNRPVWVTMVAPVQFRVSDIQSQRGN